MFFLRGRGVAPGRFPCVQKSGGDAESHPGEEIASCESGHHHAFRMGCASVLNMTFSNGSTAEGAKRR